MIPRQFTGGAGKIKAPTPEGLLKRAVMRHLRLCGWLVEINMQGLGTRNGRPDLEASKRGITIRVETKSPAHRAANGRLYQPGQLGPDQVEYIGRLSGVGIITIVTADLEEFCRELAAVEERLWPGQGSKRLFGGATGSDNAGRR